LGNVKSCSWHEIDHKIDISVTSAWSITASVIYIALLQIVINI